MEYWIPVSRVATTSEFVPVVIPPGRCRPRDQTEFLYQGERESLHHSLRL